MVILLSLFLAIFLIQVKSALLVVCSLLIKTETVFPWTLRSSRPSARATAAIREMNKLAESFSFCWVLRTTTAAHSIRLKLAILAIPTDLLATQQLPQRFSGDVHKNEMGLWKAVKKKREREREKDPIYKKWMQQPCDGCQVLTQRRVSASSCCLRLTAVIMHLIITERRNSLKKSETGYFMVSSMLVSQMIL